MVDLISPTSTSTSPSVANAALSATASNASKSSIGANYDTFLQLLITQVKNQDPSSPMKADEFTQQLVQYSELEQGIKTNEQMEQLVSSISASNAAGFVSYIGSNITAEGATSALSNGNASWNLKATNSASDVTIKILNSAGAPVYETQTSLSSGSNSFQWDGRSTSGVQYSDGEQFTINVVAKNSAGELVDVTTDFSGKVDGVDFSGSEPVLKIGNISVPQKSIRSVSAI